MDDKLNVWIELKKRELDSTNVYLYEEEKRRRRNEFLLLLLCILAIIYILPATKCNINSLIEVSSVSLKIPLKYAVIGFPTLIAATYLILINSAMKQSRLKIISVCISLKLKEVSKTLKIPADDNKQKKSNAKLHLLFLPSLIQMPIYIKAKSINCFNLIVQWIIGVVFNLIPFLTVILISVKSQDLIPSIFILSWNVLCILVMLITFIITYFNYRTINIFEGFVKEKKV